MRRDFFVPLSFVLCTLVIVGSCPLHHLKEDLSDDTQNSTTDEESIPSSFQSPQKEEEFGLVNMGGYFSRTRPSRETKQEIKQEGNDESPRLKREGNEAERNEIEVVQHKKKLAESKTSGKVADDRDEESECRSTKRCNDRPSEEFQPDIKSSNLDPVEKESSPVRSKGSENVEQHRHIRTVPVTDDLLEQELIIEDDSDMAVDILSEVPGISFDPSDRVAVLITGEPVIYHPQPPVDEEEVEIEVGIEDDFDKKRKRSLKTSNGKLEDKQTESLEFENKKPRETIVNVGIKERRKRSADESPESESVRVVLNIDSNNEVISNS